MKKANSKPDSLTALRKKAERSLRGRMDKLKSLSTRDVRDLVHELGTHQIELEMQNEELRRAQEELEASRSRYAELYDFAPVGYFMFDKKGLIHEANLTAAAMLGIERRSLMNRPFSALVAKDDRDAFHRHCSAVLENRTKQTLELRLTRRDKTEFFALLESIPVENQEGNSVFIRSAASDITVRRKVEKTLHDSEARYRSLFENMLDGYAYSRMLYDERGRPADFIYLSVNSAFERLTGLTNVVGRKATDVIPGIRDSHPELLETYGRVAATGRPEKFEIDFKPLDIWFSISVYSTERGCFTALFENITERKRAELALGISEAKYRLLFTNMAEGFALYELLYDDSGRPVDWRVLEVNDAYSHHTGLSREKIVGRRMSELFPAAIPEYLPWFVEVVATQRSQKFETYAKSVDRYQHVICFPAGPNRFASTITDITERKRAEEALRKSEDAHRTLAQNIPEIVYRADLRRTETRFFNNRISEITGYSPEELKQGRFCSLESCIAEEDRQRVIDTVTLAILDRSSFELEYRFLHKSGRAITLLERGVVISDETGVPLFIDGIIRDITERRHAEEVLRKSEEQFRSFFESTAVGTAQIDLCGRFFMVNEQFCRITGYSREELLEMTVAELTHPGERDGLEILSRYLRGELPQYDVEKRYRRKDGRVVWVHVSATLVRDADGEPVYSTGIIQDITDRKVAQEKIARKSEVLAQISRLFRDALGYDTEKALAADCLAAAVTATQSGYGFIGEIGPDGMLHDIAMSDAARNACSLSEKTGHRVPSADFTMCGLNGKVLMEGRPFFTNEPAAHPDRHGTPDGHPPLVSFLGVPLLSGEDVIGVVAVANREGGYGIEQQEALETLAPVIVEAIGRKRTENALKQYRTGLEQRVQERTAQVEEQARVLGAFFKHTPTCLVILDREFNFVLVNESFARTCSRGISDFGGHNYFTDYPSDDLRKEFQRVVDTGRSYSAASRPFVFPGKLEHGASYWDLAVSSILDERGETELVVFSLVDVTGRKRSEERISRLNRLYTVLSRVNEAIVRIRGRQELFERICRIAVEDGSFRMVWIGLTDPETLRVRPVASYGDTGGYLDSVMKHVPRDPAARSPADRAVQERREVICDDIKQNIVMLPWRDLALGHGFHSMASIPIRGESGIIGAFSFYADSPWFFADDEVGLLTSLAEDVSFAVQAMEKELQRVEAEERTRTTNELLALFSRTFGRKAYLDAVVELIRRSCNCNAAGIRVLDNFGNISYEASAGFSKDFLALERTLSLKRDSCVCTRMALGVHDLQELPAITPGGSFFSNNTARFMDGLTAEQRSRFRGSCLRKDYLTVGVVPIRYRDKVLGVIHVADEREGMAPPACVEFLEQAALFIGEALFRFGVEQESFRLAAAVESAADAVVITEPVRGVIQYVNAAFARVTGYSPEEAVGRTLHLLDSGKHDDAFYRAVREAIDRNGVWHGRLISRKKDGTLYFEDCTYSPVRSPGGEIVSYLSIKRDVTERLRLESIAESDNLMSNIGYVFSGVRHEIGNPVNSARMALSVLRQKLGRIDTDAVRDYVDRTLAEIGRVEHLLKSLRNFNLYEMPEIVSFDMAAFLGRFAGLVANDLAKKGIAFSQELLPGAEHALADPRALQQVLLNLVTNAVDALEGRPDPLIAITAERLQDSVALRVTDNGAGMTDEQQRDLFKPFYTTKTGGTGLGLVIVKKMLLQMNCGIEIESAPGKGTVVDIFLPEGAHAETR